MPSVLAPSFSCKCKRAVCTMPVCQTGHMRMCIMVLHITLADDRALALCNVQRIHKPKTQEPTAQSHRETGTEPNCRPCRGLHFERKAVQTKAGPLAGQYTQHGGRERGGISDQRAEGRLGREVARDGEGSRGRGRREKRETPERTRTKERTGKVEQSDRGHTTIRSHKCTSLTFT
jgi:hypothetical protein